MFKNDDEFVPTTNSRPALTTTEPETIIGPSVRVEGNFRGDGNVMVEGEVKGSIKTKRDVRIGEGAKVKANIDCINAYISGEVQGNIKTKEKLELSATAQVTGDIVVKSLQINSGAKLNGTIKMDEESLNAPTKEASEEKPATVSVADKIERKTKKK
jgi:cytoskeletal protein CcmA (bactofilin family)